MDKISGIITANYLSDKNDLLTGERGIASMPYGGRYRLIDFPLSNMMNFGLTSVGIITPHKYRSLLDHIGSGKPWALDRKRGGLFILPGVSYGLNRTDSHFILKDLAKNEAFLRRGSSQYVIVSSARIVANINYDDLCKKHFETGADITMLYSRNCQNASSLMGIKLDDDRVIGTSASIKPGDPAFIECFIIATDFLLKLLEWYSAIDHLDLFEAIRFDLDKMDVRACEFDGYCANICDVDSYYAHSLDLLNPDIRAAVFNPDAPIMTKSQDTVPTKYMAGCEVKNSLIPAGCIIEGRVENSVLFRYTKIEAGAVVKNSIIMQNCTICSGACVENAIIDRGNIIGANTVLRGSEDNILVLPKAK